MKICPQCKAPNEDNARFCANCGAQPSISATPPINQAAKASMSNKAIIAIILAVGVPLGILFSIFIFIEERKKQNAPKVELTASAAASQKPVPPAMLFDARRIAGKTAQEVDAALGTPVEITPRREKKGEFRDYKLEGFKIPMMVSFENNRAVQFTLNPEESAPLTAAELKRVTGIDTSGVKADEMSSTNRFWRDDFGSDNFLEVQQMTGVICVKVLDKDARAEYQKLGPRPTNSAWDGNVAPAQEYLKMTLNDYSSSEYLGWSPVMKTKIGKEPYWTTTVRLRAKNGFGAYIVKNVTFYIQNEQVRKVEGL